MLMPGYMDDGSATDDDPLMTLYHVILPIVLLQVYLRSEPVTIRLASKGIIATSAFPEKTNLANL